jgi:hypothetical protein
LKTVATEKRMGKKAVSKPVVEQKAKPVAKAKKGK